MLKNRLIVNMQSMLMQNDILDGSVTTVGRMRVKHMRVYEATLRPFGLKINTGLGKCIHIYVEDNKGVINTRFKEL